MLFDIEEVDEIFSKLDKEDTVALLVQPNPDPDCLGAAAGMNLFLNEKYGIKTEIFHIGEVSHPQNKSMINILHLKLNKGENFDYRKVSLTIVLDTDLIGTGFATDEFTEVDIRIDHHLMNRNGAKIKDVRLVGATCSIVWDWLKQAEISLEEFPGVATALVLGIKTDTSEFSSGNTTELDFKAFRDMIPLVDRDKLAKLEAYPLPASLFEHEAKAFDTKIVKNSVLVSSVGRIVPQKRDEIPIIADRFIRMDGINTSIIMGVVDKDLVVSVRSTDSTVNVASLCEDVFGEDSGAKEGCGGAKVSLISFVPVEGMELSSEALAVMETELFRHYTEKIFSTLGE